MCVYTAYNNNIIGTYIINVYCTRDKGIREMLFIL